MLLPQFEDKHPEYNASGYVFTNEEPALFNALLGDIKVKTAACIASGGEILLSVILPRAKKVYAVDHAYRALGATLLKILHLQEMDGLEYASICADHGEKFRGFTKKQKELWKQHVPEIIQKKCGNDAYWLDDSYSFAQIKQVWPAGTAPKKLTKSIINRITLLHGDLRDVPKVDLLYVSNAMEHIARDNKSPTLRQFAAHLNPGGYIMFTSGKPTYTSDEYSYGYTKQDENELYNRVGKKVPGTRTSWYYHLLQLKDGVQVEPEAVVYNKSAYSY